MAPNLFSLYVPDEEKKKMWAAQKWVRRNAMDRLRTAVKSAGLDLEDAAELTKLIDAELARLEVPS